MKIRIAIIAASAGAFALAQTDPAQAAYAGASATIGTVTSPDLESSDPAIELAMNQLAGKAGTSGAFRRGTSGSFRRGTSGSFQRLPTSGRTGR